MSYRTGRPTRVSGGQESESGSERRLERMHAMINIRDDTGKFATVQYAAVCLSDTREVLPSSEGTIQDGRWWTSTAIRS